MATQKQFEANLLNSKSSTGPSPEGCTRSRLNSTRHGLAGRSSDVEAASSGEFAERRALWKDLYRPADPGAEFALDNAVAASLRLERCRRALDDLTVAASARAELTWDEDQAVEAATVAGRLAKDPVRASRELRSTLAGVALLLEFWDGLAAALEKGGDWSEVERSMALDLLGVAPNLRAHRTKLDPPGDIDPVVYHQAVVRDEVDRLERIKAGSLVTLDEIERDQVIGGDVTMASKPARLVMRYERDAWRQLREAMKVLQAPKPEVESPRLPTAKLPPPPKSAPPPAPEPARPSTHDLGRLFPGLDVGPNWLEELEKRIGPEAIDERRARVIAELDELEAEMASGKPGATERTQIAGRPSRVGAGNRPIA
jgi:hypothetical protein